VSGRFLPEPDFSALELGRHATVYEVDGLAPCRAAVQSLARQAQRTIDIITRDLDQRLYDEAAFVEAVRHMVLASRRARVRILVRDPGPAVRSGHRLVDLSMRLDTFIELRVPGEQHMDHNSAMMVVDGTGSIQRLLADRYEATICFASRPIAAELLRGFEEMWGQAKRDPNLRRLHL
jgi:hypothetical protein